MEADGGRIGRLADDRDHLTLAHELGPGDHPAKQRPTHAPAEGFGGHVDRVLRRVAVGRAGPIGAGIGEAQDDRALLGHDEGETGVLKRAAPVIHLDLVRRYLLEAGEAMAHPMAVDRMDRERMRDAGVDEGDGHGTGPRLPRRRGRGRFRPARAPARSCRRRSGQSRARAPASSRPDRAPD